MNSIGGFREGEIDGKANLIYTLLSQIDSQPSSSTQATIDSGGDNLPTPPLFICPSLRLKVHQLKHKKEASSDNLFPLNTSPHFPSSDQQVQYLLDSESHGVICKLPVVPLFWCNNKESDNDDGEFYCGACYGSKHGTNYYFCLTCGKQFHKECVESPFEINHPSYPFQSLQLYCPPLSLLFCNCCETNFLQMFYQCPTYNLTMHPVCAMKPIPFVIDHLKRHQHSLTFFPRQCFLPCNVCGLIKDRIPTYVCLRCVFIVHRDCIYFPRVIRISRHHHRISLTSYLPPGKWSCGVCRQNVDNKYGAYSCSKCNNYFVHTRCALRGDVWDGEDLEGVPEEPEIIVEPFETVADGIILHFSHGHYLKLKTFKVYDENKLCQGCVLPVYEGSYYSCTDECDFILHEACANAPRKKHHALHPHPLTLKVVTNEYGDLNNKGYFYCNACERDSCGFVYESSVEDQDFRLDLQCALVTEPFEYQGHKHPLFLALKPKVERAAKCHICEKKDRHCRKLNCIECDFIICFKCATLPYKARYKHDKHLLTFCKVEEASDHSGWCEVCERKIIYSQKGGFYACNDYCCTTLHVHCLLGKHPYMKSGHTIITQEKAFHTLGNKTMSRPFCHGHHEHRCPYRVVFKRENMTFCSLRCLD